ncbi:hypothetical protein K8R62_03380, partial [bacterium]|nr:hypothetical protein [bacterium]
MKKIGKNKLIFALSLIFIVPTLLVSAYFVQSVQGDTYTSYYSGDSIFYYNKTVIASVNSGLAEIFEFKNGSLNKVSEISSL